MKRTQPSLAKVENLRKAGKALFILVALLLLASVALRQAQDVALAQSGDGASVPLPSTTLGTGSTSYDLSWWTVDSGGYTFSTDGDYSLSGIIGQADAGVLIDSDYTLVGGFWGGAEAPAAPGMRPIYLPIVLKNYP